MFLDPGSRSDFNRMQAVIGRHNGALPLSGIKLTGNVRAATWALNGIRVRSIASTYTDISAAGTVANACTDCLGGNTVAAAAARTFTNYFGMYVKDPVAGANTTFTNKWSLGLEGSLYVGGGVQVGPATATNNIPGAFLPLVFNIACNYAPTNTSGGTANQYWSMQFAPSSNSAGFNTNLFVDTGVPSTSTVTYNSIYGIYSINQYNGIGNVTDQVVGAQFAANNGSVSALVSILEGVAFSVSNQSTGSVGTAYGADSIVANFSTGAITQSYALKSNTIQSNAGGTWTNAVGLWITLSNLGTMTNFVGLNIVPTSGAATNNTHILLGTATPQAGNYNIYANDSYPTFLGGGIHIGAVITTGDIAGATVIANNVMNYAPTNTAASTAVINKLATTQLSAASNSASTFYGTYFDLNIPSSSTVTYGTLFGTISVVKNFGSGTVNLIEASNFAVSHNSTGIVNNAEGMNGSVLNASTGTITNAFAGIFTLQNSSTGTISTGYGFRVTILNNGTFTACTGILINLSNTLTMGNFVGLNVNASTATNNTHVLLGTVTPPSGNYAIYSSGSYATYLGGAVQMANYGAGTATFDASGNVTSVSDERVKEFKRPYSRSIADLMKIGRPIIFKYRPDNPFGLETEHEYAGYFAQDVQRGIPEAVGIGPDGYLSLSDRPIIAAAVNGLIDHEARIAALETRLH